jgi:hypothetical protein
MQITVEGYRKHNKKMFCALGNAAEFYGDMLLGKRMSKNIILEIKLTRELKQKEQAYGYCQITDDNLSKPREFMIELDTAMKHPLDQILIWLAHEVVHVKQFVRGELCDYATGSVQWKSKRYSRNVKYNEQPWEQEAYRLEDKLYEQFAEWYSEQEKYYE